MMKRKKGIKKFWIGAAIISAAWGMGSVNSVWAQESRDIQVSGRFANRAAALQVWKPAELAGTRVNLDFLPGTGLVRMAEFSRPYRVKDFTRDHRKNAWSFFREFGKGFGILDPDRELVFVTSKLDSAGNIRLSFKQRISGYEVVGGDLSVLMDAEYRVFACYGNSLHSRSFPVAPRISSSEAGNIAEMEGKARVKWIHPSPMILPMHLFNPTRMESYLAWKVTLRGGGGSDWEYFVDSSSGEILSKTELALPLLFKTYWGNGNSSDNDDALAWDGNTRVSNFPMADSAHEQVQKAHQFFANNYSYYTPGFQQYYPSWTGIRTVAGYDLPAGTAGRWNNYEIQLSSAIYNHNPVVSMHEYAHSVQQQVLRDNGSSYVFGYNLNNPMTQPVIEGIAASYEGVITGDWTYHGAQHPIMNGNLGHYMNFKKFNDHDRKYYFVNRVSYLISKYAGGNAVAGRVLYEAMDKYHWGDASILDLYWTVLKSTENIWGLYSQSAAVDGVLRAFWETGLNTPEPKFALVGNFNGDGGPIEWTDNPNDWIGKCDVAWQASSGFYVGLSSGDSFGLTGNGVNRKYAGFDPYWLKIGSKADATLVGDFDGNHADDLLCYTANKGWYMFRSKLSVFEKRGLATPEPFGNPGDMLVGDFNGDGKDDLAGWDYNFKGYHVLFGNTSGAFQEGNFWSQNFGGPGITLAGDFNGDGKCDILGYNSSAKAWHLLCSDGYKFAQDRGIVTPKPFGAPGEMLVGDFNGDGKTDLAGWNWVTLTYHVLYGTASGQFNDGGHWTSKGFGGPPPYAKAGDFNGDGLDDIMGWNDDARTWHIAISTGKSFNSGDERGGFWWY